MIRTVRRVVRARRIVLPGQRRQNGEYPTLLRLEYMLACGHTKVVKPRADRRLPQRVTCEWC